MSSAQAMHIALKIANISLSDTEQSTITFQVWLLAIVLCSAQVKILY